jgi:hypothetical protein
VYGIRENALGGIAGNAKWLVRDQCSTEEYPFLKNESTYKIFVNKQLEPGQETGHVDWFAILDRNATGADTDVTLGFLPPTDDSCVCDITSSEVILAESLVTGGSASFGDWTITISDESAFAQDGNGYLVYIDGTQYTLYYWGQWIIKTDDEVPASIPSGGPTSGDISYNTGTEITVAGATILPEVNTNVVFPDIGRGLGYEVISAEGDTFKIGDRITGLTGKKVAFESCGDVSAFSFGVSNNFQDHDAWKYWDSPDAPFLTNSPDETDSPRWILHYVLIKYPKFDYLFEWTPTPPTAEDLVESARTISQTTTQEDVLCAHDTHTCPDGSVVSRDIDLGCEFPECPDIEIPVPSATVSVEEVFCPADVHTCPDGSYVGRDPNNNCEFEECPEVITTTPTPAPINDDWLLFDASELSSDASYVTLTNFRVENVPQVVLDKSEYDSFMSEFLILRKSYSGNLADFDMTEWDDHNLYDTTFFVEDEDENIYNGEQIVKGWANGKTLRWNLAEVYEDRIINFSTWAESDDIELGIMFWDNEDEYSVIWENRYDLNLPEFPPPTPTPTPLIPQCDEFCVSFTVPNDGGDYSSVTPFNGATFVWSGITFYDSSEPYTYFESAEKLIETETNETQTNEGFTRREGYGYYFPSQSDLDGLEGFFILAHTWPWSGLTMSAISLPDAIAQLTIQEQSCPLGTHECDFYSSTVKPQGVGPPDPIGTFDIEITSGACEPPTPTDD